MPLNLAEAHKGCEALWWEQGDEEFCLGWSHCRERMNDGKTLLFPNPGPQLCRNLSQNPSHSYWFCLPHLTFCEEDK